MRTEQPVQGDADIAQIGALIGDPARARVLTALTDGRALPASRLAAEAGVAPSTVSEHLARPLAAGLVTVRPEGRSRVHRLASPEVADALEAISRTPAEANPRLAPPGDPRPGPAGGPDLLQPPGLPARHGLSPSPGCSTAGCCPAGTAASPGTGCGGPAVRPGPRPVPYRLTPRGEAVLGEIGVDLDEVLARQPAVRYCLDWSEQQHHLAGPLGTALADRLFALDWVRRTDRRRVVRLTELRPGEPARDPRAVP